MLKPPLTAVEAEAILLMATKYARASALFAMEPFGDNEEAVKKAEKHLREFVYKLAGGA